MESETQEFLSLVLNSFFCVSFSFCTLPFGSLSSLSLVCDASTSHWMVMYDENGVQDREAKKGSHGRKRRVENRAREGNRDSAKGERPQTRKNRDA